ncbi:MAG: hypothetical protein JST86_01960 [Bacteroidetes bacterium]|nr:hypothetical protein [Bacteroidota bacterium]
MAFLIKWADEARLTFDNNINYLLEAWTEREIRNFIRQTQQVIQIIEKEPLRFRPSAKSNAVRRAPINKHITLFYKIFPAKKEVVLLSFWHNKQNPGKLKY